MAIFSSTEIHTSHTNKTQGTEPVLHRNQHAVNYRVKNHKIVSLQNEPPCYGSGQRSGHFQAGFLEGGGVSLNLGASTHSLLISEMFPKGDNEYFSVNCSFCISLAACSPSLASTEIPGPPETRTSLSATAPRANGAGKPRIPVPAPGKRTAPGQLGEAGTRERWWEGEGAQTHRGRSNRLYAGTPSPDTPLSFLPQPSNLNLFSQLK